MILVQVERGATLVTGCGAMLAARGVDDDGCADEVEATLGGGVLLPGAVLDADGEDGEDGEDGAADRPACELAVQPLSAATVSAVVASAAARAGARP